jgi:putative MATE family efflux protein
MKKPKAKLTEGDVGKTLFKLALPMLVGIVGMVTFNLVDTYFVGRIGKNELAAMSFTFPVVLVIQSISLGLGIGASSVISRAIGKGDHSEVRRLTTDSLFLSLVIVAVVVFAGMITIDPLFRLLGATEDLIPLIREYMRIWYIGTIFVVVPMVGNNAIRATGDTKTPSLVMLVAITVNVIFDPLLIFGLGPFPQMGLRGAALATVMARATTFTVALLVLFRREKMITLKLPSASEIFSSWRRILYVALPAAGANLINPVSMGIITRLASIYGAAAVAALGVGTRIEMFALTPAHALAMVLIPFIGQNLGAGKHERIKKGIKQSIIFSLLWGVLIFLIALAAARPIASIFNKSPDVIENIRFYLIIVSISFGMQGVFLLLTSAFNAMNKPLNAAFVSLIRMIGLYIPLALLGSRLFELIGIFGAASLANIITGCIAIIWILRSQKKVAQS